MSRVENPSGDLLFYKYIAPHIKTTKEFVSGSDDLVYYGPNGVRETSLNSLKGRVAVYTLMSGVQIIINTNAPANAQRPGIVMYVDLNGYKTLPNRFGRDMFRFVIYPEYGLVLHYTDDGEDGSVKKTRDVLLNGPSAQGYDCKNRGLWCAALIQADGWTISKDYPWK